MTTISIGKSPARIEDFMTERRYRTEGSGRQRRNNEDELFRCFFKDHLPRLAGEQRESQD
jgi:hypothetical protein